jgi:hypothetical protein
MTVIILKCASLPKLLDLFLFFVCVIISNMMKIYACLHSLS